MASQNIKDFCNLVNVYTDAVLYPRAIHDPVVHAQEGWHLELEHKQDPLIYKGVVYNEMKGVYSSSDSLLQRESQRSLFPDNTYGVDSGGDPTVIPQLSFQQFCDFHANYYHPSNARIYFSGDDDVYTRLAVMDDYLQDFETPDHPSDTTVAWQTQRYSQPLQTVHPYPASPDQPDTHMLTLNWLLHDRTLSATQELTLNILDHLLLGTSSSILRKTLMESGLGTALTGGGLSDELLQATFSVGLKGVAPNNTKAVETLILETLAQIAKDGFTQQAMAASMNTIEFAARANKQKTNPIVCCCSLIELFGINTATGIQHWIRKGTFLHAG